MQLKNFNASRYSQLLAKTAPRVIRTDKELDRFVTMLGALEERQDCSPEEIALAELLAVLIDMRRSVMPISRPVDDRFLACC